MMIFRRSLAAIAVLAAVSVAVLVNPSASQAAQGGALPVGSSVCTDRVYSAAGVYAYGHATPYRQPVTWTIRTSQTTDGPESVLVRLTQWELTTVRATASTPGFGYYRACLEHTGDKAVDYRLQLSPNPGPDARLGVGPHTARLGAGGKACGEWIGGYRVAHARLVGTSDIPVRFSIRVEDGDGNFLGERPLATGTAIEQDLIPPLSENYEVCVSNGSAGTATVSWEAQIVSSRL